MRAGATVFGLVVMVAACGSRTDLDLAVVPQPLDPALVEACTKLVSCPATYEVGYTGVSPCLWLNVAADYGVGVGLPRFLLTAVTTDFFSYASVGCLASAPDCAAVARCVAGDTSFDCNATPGGGCVGDTWVRCRQGKPYAVDCASSPLSPLVPCIPTPRLACNPATYDDRCDGTRLVYCDGAERSIDCAAIGFRTCGSALGYPACTR